MFLNGEFQYQYDTRCNRATKNGREACQGTSSIKRRVYNRDTEKKFQHPQSRGFGHDRH